MNSRVPATSSARWGTGVTGAGCQGRSGCLARDTCASSPEAASICRKARGACGGRSFLGAHAEPEAQVRQRRLRDAVGTAAMDATPDARIGVRHQLPVSHPLRRADCVVPRQLVGGRVDQTDVLSLYARRDRQISRIGTHRWVPVQAFVSLPTGRRNDGRGSTRAHMGDTERTGLPDAGDVGGSSP